MCSWWIPQLQQAAHIGRMADLNIQPTHKYKCKSENVEPRQFSVAQMLYAHCRFSSIAKHKPSSQREKRSQMENELRLKWVGLIFNTLNRYSTKWKCSSYMMSMCTRPCPPTQIQWRRRRRAFVVGCFWWRARIQYVTYTYIYICMFYALICRFEEDIKHVDGRS